MKHRLLLLFIVLGLCACSQPIDVLYSDNDPLILEVGEGPIKILQLTDLHLTYGLDYNDRTTYRLIEQMIVADQYDLVVFTGDMVMSPLALPLLRHLVRVVEGTQTPWTFVFGNHDDDYHDKGSLLSVFEETDYLYFKTGPQIDEGGVGNFKLTFTSLGVPIYHAYFLDTKNEREDYTEEEGSYDYLSIAQVDWFASFYQQDTLPSVAFMHTPLRQFILATSLGYEGNFNENVHPQGRDTGFFDVAVERGLLKGVFVGHDHENDFQFDLDGITLAYGRLSGLNGYGPKDIGGRVIILYPDGRMETSIIIAGGTHD